MIKFITIILLSCLCTFASDSLVASSKQCWCWWKNLDTTIDKIAFIEQSYANVIYVYYKVTDQQHNTYYFVKKSVLPAIGALTYSTYKLDKNKWEKLQP